MARILVVDDVATLCALLRAVLEEQGHDVAEAVDGAACLDMLARERFDAVVLDMMMPGMDGIETVKRIRRDDGRIAIIAISGGAQGFPAGMALSMSRMYGADRLLVKPFTNADLIQTVNELLAVQATV